MPRKLSSEEDVEDFEQELVDQYALAQVGSGLTDSYVADERSAVFEFRRFLDRPVWTATPEDADRFLISVRKKGRSPATAQSKAATITRFYGFLISRYQGDVLALTGAVLVQPIDEFNRPAKVPTLGIRVPPSEDEVEQLFGAWRASLSGARSATSSVTTGRTLTPHCCRANAKTLSPDGATASKTTPCASP